MSIADNLFQLLVGLLVFIVPYPVFIIGLFVYFFDKLHRLTMGLLLLVFGGVGVLFWFAVLDFYVKTYGVYSSVILSDINSSKLPLAIGVLSIGLGVFSIIRRKSPP
jgi:hypothetical protein